MTPSFLTASGAATPRGAQTPRGTKTRSVVSLNALNDKLTKLKAQSEGGKLRKRESLGTGLKRQVSLGSRRGPGHIKAEDHHDGIAISAPVIPPLLDVEEADEIGVATTRYNDDSDSETDSGSMFVVDELSDDTLPGQVGTHHRLTPPEQTYGGYAVSGNTAPHSPTAGFDLASPRLPMLNSGLDDPEAIVGLAPPRPAWADDGGRRARIATPSMLSIDGVVGSKTDYNLQKVDPFFTDSSGEFFHEFEQRLQGLNGSNSDKTCIEEYLVKSEKKWFTSFRDAKLGRHQGLRSTRSSFDIPRSDAREISRAASFLNDQRSEPDERHPDPNSLADEFLLGKDYVPPTGLKKWMQLRVGDWPVYAFFMGFGQIIAANSYQITLLTGEVGQTAGKLYAIASIYLVTSLCWWYLYRRMQSAVCLSLPFFFYGLAFVFIGLAHFSPSVNGRGWIQNVGTAWYAVASSSGSIFFALNFGDEGGAQIKAWVFRACVIQGTQQIYVVALWAWGAYLSKRNMEGLLSSDPVSQSWKITAITLPIAVLLWAVGLIMWFGLPNYYRQHPGKMPSFYTSVYRRKIVMWFFVTVLIQNFFLSAPYGRNWSFLWSSSTAQTWQIVLLVIFFFVFVWAAFLGVFAWLSKSHSWILPLFAIGLGAPRWAQIWWGTSNIGLYLPWAGGPVASALASRSLWLWLGTLDAIQGVGLGMILLATLTRVHVAFTLIMAQALGSIATIVARACAPNKIGPGPISPDISMGANQIFTAWFWIGLVLNLSCCAGFFLFYRKEQLSKP